MSEEKTAVATSPGGLNILLIILDALRARHLSCYGYELRTTPHLDAFAGENVLFSQAFAPATWTIPTHASLLSGLYLSQHRIENIQATRRFNPAIVTLPAALRSVGYDTIAFSQNMLFSPDHHLGGFDTFLETRKWVRDYPFVRCLKRSVGDRSGPGRWAIRYLEKMTASRLLLNAMYEWIVEHPKGRPFFVMANLVDTHYAWAPAPGKLMRHLRFNPLRLLKREFSTLEPWQFNTERKQVTAEHRRIWRCMYDAAISHLDHEVGRFLRRLQRWNGHRDTVIVLTADHGEMLGDYRDIVGHMLTLHDNILHVPLMIHHPDYPSGLRVQGVVQTLDLYPSILEWAGVSSGSIPPAQLQRPSLTRAVETPGDAGGYAFAEEDYTDSYDVIGGLVGANPQMDPKKYPRRQVAVRSARHKYIWCDDRPGEFYDFERDPDEQENLMDRLGAGEEMALATLREALEEWRTSLTLFPPEQMEPEGEMDNAVIERLRALGYIV
jgi:arylsulfatase A-like enzyme